MPSGKQRCNLTSGNHCEKCAYTNYNAAIFVSECPVIDVHLQMTHLSIATGPCDYMQFMSRIFTLPHSNVLHQKPGPGCSKLTTSFVNVSLNFKH